MRVYAVARCTYSAVKHDRGGDAVVGRVSRRHLYLPKLPEGKLVKSVRYQIAMVIGMPTMGAGAMLCVPAPSVVSYALSMLVVDNLFAMKVRILNGPLSPPPGRPCWLGDRDLPLIYLGWGSRDFSLTPVNLHRDNGSNYYVVISGSIEIQDGRTKTSVTGPTALIFDTDCTFAIAQRRTEKVQILVWIWQGRTPIPGLRPPRGSFRTFSLCHPLDRLFELHSRCRAEVAQPDMQAARSLSALRRLVEVEILRASYRSAPDLNARWKLAESWMRSNLSIHTPIPALCEYLRMSPSTLHRFFHAQAGESPGAYFRSLKMREALRLIHDEGLQVKLVAYQLGYRHANELSRALSMFEPRTQA